MFYIYFIYHENKLFYYFVAGWVLFILVHLVYFACKYVSEWCLHIMFYINNEPLFAYCTEPTQWWLTVSMSQQLCLIITSAAWCTVCALFIFFSYLYNWSRAEQKSGQIRAFEKRDSSVLPLEIVCNKTIFIITFHQSVNVY